MKQVLLSILVIGILLLSACGAPSPPPPFPPPAEETAPQAEAPPAPPLPEQPPPPAETPPAPPLPEQPLPPAETPPTPPPPQQPAAPETPSHPPKPEAPPEAEPISEPEPIEFSGQGDDVSSKFTLEEGITIITMTHSGSSNFQLELLDDGGETVEWLVNEIGSFDGRKAIGVREDNWMGAKPGIHLLDITADGNWTVRIEQPRPTSADALPLNLTGKGCDVSSFFVLNEGLTIFNMSHDGVSNFMVYLLSGDGEVVEYLANEIGSYSGKEAIGVKRGNLIGAEPGIHILSITADGNWTISISQ